MHDNPEGGYFRIELSAFGGVARGGGYFWGAIARSSQSGRSSKSLAD